jgi:dihydrofolate reductase
MEVTIQAAVSADGFIAKEDGGTDWVQDLELYEQMCRKYGCIAMGRTTYDEYGGPAFEGVQHIVLSRRTQQSAHQNVHFVQSAEQAVAKAKELGFDKLLVIGGGQTNGNFMQTGLAKRLLLNVHPLILGRGKPLFGHTKIGTPLHFKSVKQHPAFIQIQYAVKQ